MARKQCEPGGAYLLNWKPTQEPQHYTFFEEWAVPAAQLDKHCYFNWRVPFGGFCEGDRFLFKRGTGHGNPGIIAMGVFANDRDDEEPFQELKFTLINPSGYEVSNEEIRKINPDILKLVGSGKTISSTDTKKLIAVLERKYHKAIKGN